MDIGMAQEEVAVLVVADVAVLTFNYVSWGSEGEARWNCTEVFRHDPVGWRIIQTHWSYTNTGTPTRTMPRSPIETGEVRADR